MSLICIENVINHAIMFCCLISNVLLSALEKKKPFLINLFHGAYILLMGKDHSLAITCNKEKKWLKAEICKQLESSAGKSGPLRPLEVSRYRKHAVRREMEDQLQKKPGTHFSQHKIASQFGASVSSINRLLKNGLKS